MGNKAVLISIRPRWCALIASGEKTVEIRKSRPKMQTPFKCYIYETRGFERVGNDNLNCVVGGNGRGAVIGEFICNDIRWNGGSSLLVKEDRENATRGSCVSREELLSYLGIVPGTRVYDKRCEFYCWHISELKIYDDPKELSHFWKVCPKEHVCSGCEWYFPGVMDYGRCEPPCCGFYEDDASLIKRPPQSWGYVEELDE